MDVKYPAPYQHKVFGQKPMLLTVQEIHSICEHLDRAAEIPWVLLSAGVSLEEFLEAVHLAGEGGGFLCGRTIWKGVMNAYPDEGALRAHMESTGRSHFQGILRANETARSWPDHPRFQAGSAP